MKKENFSKGYTLLETVIVVVIIGLILFLAIKLLFNKKAENNEGFIDVVYHERTNITPIEIIKSQDSYIPKIDSSIFLSNNVLTDGSTNNYYTLKIFIADTQKTYLLRKKNYLIFLPQFLRNQTNVSYDGDGNIMIKVNP